MDESSSMPWFPAWGIGFAEPLIEVSEAVTQFSKWRPSERWLLLAYDVACSEVRLWTAWTALRRLEESGRMVARTCDAEFLRLISGTHQLSSAFERAGISSGDQSAWIIHLPEIKIGEEFGRMEIPRTSYLDNEIEATRLMEHLGARLLARRPVPSEAGLLRLGVIERGDSIEATRQEDSFLLHTALADM
ncbi:MAG: hypothetical protein EVA35_02500 [Candidatus Poseidoniales archaeon]|nr:MAG: hypothetical protein EVA35_02500 [Candidatus Poseidoniales archaeon]